MSTSAPRERSSRKGQFSCNFCRKRKLRCDRPLPCTSCRSRGKTCEFDPTPTALYTQIPVVVAPVLHPQQSQATVFASAPSQQAPTPCQASLIAEIQALRKVTQDLEHRFFQSSTSQQPHGHGDSSSVAPAISSPDSGLPTPASGANEVSDIVSRLQLVSMSQISQNLIGVNDDLIFKVEHIRAIPQAPSYIAQLGKPIACIWLPTQREASVLVDHYIGSISRLQHIVHQPSLSTMIEDVYRQIEGREMLKPGHIIMLLSIIASATHVWVSCDHSDSDGPLFLSPTQAHTQTSMWIKATHTVLNAAQSNPAIELETIQGIAILGCVLCNIEGVSIRYRQLMSTAMVLGRELGLHRIDQNSDANATGSLRTEMGRRVWWYLVATDWLMAARFGGAGGGVYQNHPLHMTVNKPCNINDLDLIENSSIISLPLDQPTDMSYFIQRIRLAEISRSIVDHNLINATASGRPNYYAHIMAMDFELDQMMRNVPHFFQLETYTGKPLCNTSEGSFFQAYLLNSMVHLQRCKLHLAYLTAGSSDNPAYAASRGACLKSARQIIRGESQLLQSQHPFVQVRLRFAAILYGIFIASIILMMDTCLHRPASLEEEMSSGDLAEALQMVRDVKDHSLAAATLYESLIQIAERYRAQQRQQKTDAITPTETHLPLTPTSSTTVPVGDHFQWGGDADALQNQSFNEQQESDLGTSMFTEQVQWDDLITGLVSSSFF